MVVNNLLTMKNRHLIIVVILAFNLLSCNSGSNESESTTAKEEGHSFPVAAENGKFFEIEGRSYLYGGEDSSQHFNITDYTLKDDQFHFGIGREKFPALLEPKFIGMIEADSLFSDSVRFLFLNMDGVRKAYSIEDLTRHEVVNDEVNGQPIMAAYCILADLGAVYDRNMADKKFTFALSGYTYFDEKVWDGMDGFVLWDRETESLWWPLIGEAVSGPMKGAKMKVLEEEYWQQTTWGDIKSKFNDVQVLEPGQDYEHPAEWAKYDDIQLVKEENESIAPRWGDHEK